MCLPWFFCPRIAFPTKPTPQVALRSGPGLNPVAEMLTGLMVFLWPWPRQSLAKLSISGLARGLA